MEFDSAFETSDTTPLTTVVAEVFSHRQRCMAHAVTGTRSFVHLAEHHHGLVQDAGIFHIPIKFFRFAAPFADSAEQVEAVMLTHNVIDQFCDQDRLANTRSAEESGLATSFQRSQHFNDNFVIVASAQLRLHIRQAARKVSVHDIATDSDDAPHAIEGISFGFCEHHATLFLPDGQYLGGLQLAYQSPPKTLELESASFIRLPCLDLRAYSHSKPCRTSWRLASWLFSPAQSHHDPQVDGPSSAFDAKCVTVLVVHHDRIGTIRLDMG